MADAPSGGSGSSWGAFEVILGILLVVGLLSNISGKPITPVSETKNTNKEVVKPTDDSSKRCGLSITAPLSMQNVYESVTVSGSVNGCNWKQEEGKALFAQIINGAGVPVSDFVTVETNPNDILKASFDKTIVITGKPTGTGYILLIPIIQQDPEKPITVRIPIKFVRR